MIDTEIAKELEEVYKKDQLQQFASFFEERGLSTFKKNELVKIILHGFSTRELFETFYNGLSKAAQIVSYHLTWYGATTLDEVDKKYKIYTCLGDYCSNTNEPFIKIFKEYYRQDISFSPGLRRLFKEYLPMPKVGEIRIQPPSEDSIVKADLQILDLLEAVEVFIRDEKLRSKSIEKNIPAQLVKKFTKNLGLSEVQGLKKGLRAQYILRFFCLKEYGKKSNPLDYLESLLEELGRGDFDGAYRTIEPYLFFPNVKGFSYLGYIDLFMQLARHVFYTQIENNYDSWVNIDNLVFHFSFMEIQLFDPTFIAHSLYVRNNGYEYLSNLDAICKHLISPFFRGFIFLLHSIGAADIEIDKNNIGLYPLDSISSYKLTPLGERLFKKNMEFDYKKTNTMEYVFMEEKAIISTKGQDPMLEILFSLIGDKIGEGDYYITPESFIRNCNTLDDVEINLVKLEKLLGKKRPEVWSRLLSEINNRVDPLFNEQEVLLVSIPTENKLFIEIITMDDKIKNLYSMVEGGKIAINPVKYREFKKQLKKYGFFIP